MAFWVLALCGALVAGQTDSPGGQVPSDDQVSSDDQGSVPILVISENTQYTSWPEIMYFPDAQGQPRPGKILGEGYYVPAGERDVTFKLYTRRGPKEGEDLSIGDIDGLRRSTFNSSQETFFITHGFLSGIESETVQSIKNMYIGFKEGNVVAVDWSGIASNWLYFIVKRQTVPVGGFVAQFVEFLVQEGGVDLKDVHLVGHSLGAHVMGIAGKGVIRHLNSKVDRITGLDPAGPLFSLNDKEHRLDRSDAEFVDVIHTCGGWLGFPDSIGHVDFYPNGGRKPQPGCFMDLVTAGTCSHSRAWEFFAESINSFNFTSIPCDSYEDFQSQQNCNDLLKAPMGEPAPKRIVGGYYLYTADSSPFALG